jgi:hypothetical protein
LYPDGGPSVFPQGGFFESIQQPLRLLQEVRLRDTWLASIGGSRHLGVNDIETSATFAFPIFYNQAPLLVTPGFALHLWDGPITAPPENADLPPQTFDAYLDAGWHPQLTPWFGANLGVRTGVYTDFHTFTIHSIRVMGRGLGVITLTPTVQVAVGVVYLDRNKVKLLPAGGVIWTPNPDARYEILFPNPKLAHRFTTLGTVDVWWYLSGEYGGGAWTIKRAGGGSDDVDYNDLRVALGIEGIALSGFRSMFEVGYVFQREIIYRSAMPDRFVPNDTLMLRGGISF